MRPALLSHFGVTISFTFSNRVRQIIPIIDRFPNSVSCGVRCASAFVQVGIELPDATNARSQLRCYRLYGSYLGEPINRLNVVPGHTRSPARPFAAPTLWNGTIAKCARFGQCGFWASTGS